VQPIVFDAMQNEHILDMIISAQIASDFDIRLKSKHESK